MPKLKFTNTSVERECLPPAPDETRKNGEPISQKLYHDAQLRGFYVIVGRQPADGGPPTKTFYVQADIKGDTVRRKIGRFPKVTVEQARRAAKDELADMARGIDPRAATKLAAAAESAAAWQRLTLDEAMEHHIVRLTARGCASTTISDLRAEFKNHLGDWLGKPLASIDPEDCFERHATITNDSGPRAANKCMAKLRAVWNSTKRMHPRLGEHPVRAVEFNPQEACKTIIPGDQLPDWWSKMRLVGNPVRRYLQVTMLFSGLRRSDASKIRWSEIDLAAGTIHRPSPKGGKAKAFTVPLARFLVRLLARHQRYVQQTYGKDCPWVFPTHNRAGKLTHTVAPQIQKYDWDADGKLTKTNILPSPHTLRRTFRTVAYHAGVDEYTVKILMNHALPSGKGNVTDGYLMPDRGYGDPIRVGVDRTAALLLKAKRPKRTASDPTSTNQTKIR